MNAAPYVRMPAAPHVRTPAAPHVRTPAAFGILALLLLLGYALAFQGSRGLWSPDEGRYVEVAVEMLDTGDFIHPRLHHEQPHYTKPPLTYWAIAGSIAAFGHSEFAARLPNALAFVLTVVLMAALGRDLVPQRPRVPAVVYATMLLPFVAANSVTTDTLLALCTTLYGWAFVRARALPPGQAQRGFVLVLWLGAGLAFLTKGPPGLLPLAGLALFAWSERARRGSSHYLTAQALLLFVVVGFAWFAKVVLDRPEMMRYFLVDEVYKRMASSEFRRNAEWYGGMEVYLPTLLLGSLPWTWPLLRRTFGALAAPRRALAALGADAETRLLLCWFGVPLLVFFLARSRLPYYILPLAAPLALLAARSLPARLPRWVGPALALWLVLLVALRGGTAHWPSKQDDRALAYEVQALDVARIDEVGFVDTVPHYGLGFYLDREVERLSVDPSPDARVQAESLESELADPEGCRVLLVERDTVPALAAELRRLGAEVRELGRVRGYDVYGLPAASCPARAS